jgi:hypothetical protein
LTVDLEAGRQLTGNTERHERRAETVCQEPDAGARGRTSKFHYITNAGTSFAVLAIKACE